MALGADRATLRRVACGQAGRGAAVALCLLAAFALTACNPRRQQAVPVASAADLPAAELTGPGSAAPGSAAPRSATMGAAPARVTGATGAVTRNEPTADSFEVAAPADPDEVMGLGRTAIQALLGEPGLVRHEAPAEVWQYQSGGCVLDVFLYQATADFEVVYLEARTGQALNAATANCLGAVMDHRRKTPAS